MLVTTLSQVIIAKQIWDPKEFTALKASPIQNVRVNKKDIEDFQKIMDNAGVKGKAAQSMANPNWFMVSGNFSFADFTRALQIMNYSKVSLEAPFEGYAIESML
jgi:hypothetical protein